MNSILHNKGQHNQYKTEPIEHFFEQRMMEDLSSRNNDPDFFWMTLLENNGNLPKPKRKETIVDKYLRQTNLNLLKDAMYQSHSQHQGYLHAKDVVQQTLAYSTVHYLGLSKGDIRGAIHSARSQDMKMGLVNIDMFIQALVDIDNTA